MVKINSTAVSLSLILSSIEQDLAPAVDSDAGKRALYLIQTTLLDLLKRQGPAAALLRNSIEAGKELARTILEDLGENALALPTATPLDVDFDTLSTYHAELTRTLAELCNSLSKSTNIHSRDKLRQAAEWELSYEIEVQKLTAIPFDTDILAQHEVDKSLIESKKDPQPSLSKEFLNQFLNSRRGPLEVKSFSQMTGGYGKQTYQCEVGYENGSTEVFIIRKSDAAPIISFGMYNPSWEYDLLRDLATAAYPAPHPSELCENDLGVDGEFYTMNRLPGSVQSNFLDIATRAYPLPLILNLATLLARLHSVPLTTFTSFLTKHEGAAAINYDVSTRYRNKIIAWRDYITQSPHLPSPYLIWLLDWLDAHLPHDTRTPVLTHGDFNFHNLLIDDKQEAITGVLDWECADFGAPELDLAYVQPLVKRHMPWEEFMAHYHLHGGKEIDEGLFPFVQAFGVVEKIIAFNKATWLNQSGISRDIRFVMVGYGINAAFMGMGLAYTQEVEGEKQEPPVENLSIQSDKAETVLVEDVRVVV